MAAGDRVPGVRSESEPAAGGRPHHVPPAAHPTSVTAGTIFNRTRMPLTVITTAARSRHSAGALDIG
jgi:hypothetical protein